jgi:pantothenate kinase
MQMEEFLELVKEISKNTEERYLIGIVGKPGAGKSTIVEKLKKKFPDDLVSAIPMDGYHLSNEILIRQGKRERKGAPDTFDVASFVELLKRVKSAEGEIRFPVFHREIEASVADEGMVPVEAKVIVTEGNYLLAKEYGWNEVAPLLNKCFFIDIDDELRLQRLIDRHIKYGKTFEEAKAWSEGSDEANARFIERTKLLADGIINL